MPRLQGWEKEPWTWKRFRRLPMDLQVFAAVTVLGAASVILLTVALPLFHRG